MTVDHWKGECVASSNGKINLSGTVGNLKMAEQTLGRAVSLHN